MKKLLIQLDTDKHPSTFDRIVAYDAGVDEVLSYSNIVVGDVKGLAQSAFFTRGLNDLKNTAIWVGGSDVTQGEQVLAEAQASFFGPFRVSLMLDSNGCNTTAATAIAKLKKDHALTGKKAVVLGLGAVGLRAAALLLQEGCHVTAASIRRVLAGATAGGAAAGGEPASGNAVRSAPSKSVENARRISGLQVEEAGDRAEMEALMEGAEIAVCSGPANAQVLPKAFWAAHPTLKMLVDFNAAEPLGIEGIKASDDMKEREGKLILGPLGIGNTKMKVHKACIAKLFESNDQIFDVQRVYEVAGEMV